MSDEKKHHVVPHAPVVYAERPLRPPRCRLDRYTSWRQPWISNSPEVGCVDIRRYKRGDVWVSPTGYRGVCQMVYTSGEIALPIPGEDEACFLNTIGSLLDAGWTVEPPK